MIAEPLKITLQNDVRHEEPHKRRHESSRRRETDSRSRRRSPKNGTMHSDRFPKDRDRRKRFKGNDYDEDFDSAKPRSKVTVVIKTQKKPTVASQISSRLHADREENRRPVKSRVRRYSSSESSSESSSGSNSNSSTSSTSSYDSSSSSDEGEKQVKPSIKSRLQRPGFRSDSRKENQRSPLRIEISNERFGVK